MATMQAPAKETAAPAAKKATKAEWVRFAAEKLELTTKQYAAFTELLGATAIQEAKKNGEFTIFGLSKLELD
jgi:DNA-binding protein HU-beta